MNLRGHYNKHGKPKREFANREEAEAFADQNKLGDTYHCEGHWHVTSQAAKQRRARLNRQADARRRRHKLEEAR